MRPSSRPRHLALAAAVASLTALLVAVPAAPVHASTADPRENPSPLPAAAKLSTRSPWPDDAVAGSLLVTTDGVDDAELLARATGGRRIGRTVDVRVGPGTEAAAAAGLWAASGVRAVEPNRLRRVQRLPNDPQFGEQWSHALTRAQTAWDTTTGTADVQVAIIDSGVDGTHSGLAANVVGQVDVSSGTVVDRGIGVNNDSCGIGHGTAVAGIIGAAGDDGRDVAGVAWQVGLVDIAATDPVYCGVFSDGALLAGLDHASSLGVDVINLSLGAPADTCPTALQTAISAARSAEIAIVAAAGNEQHLFPGLTSVPASCNGVIGVGAVGQRGTPTRYSNANDWVDLVAPGGDVQGGEQGVLSTWPGQTTRSVEGSSFSAPYVSGAIALLRSVRPTLTPSQLESILERTTASGGTRSPAMGWGLVDVGAAVQRAASGTAVEPPAAEPPFPVGLVMRVSDQSGTTDPIRQSVAISRWVFPDGSARHAVLARRDDFPDALAGSTLGFGAGPLLFSGRTGPLDGGTARELLRTLPAGAVVYILGGTSALPGTIEGDLRTLGFQPRRLAGVTREGTAARVADEVVRHLPELGFESPRHAVLATAGAWPDAVTAGSLGAFFGAPILLTGRDSLHPATRDALARLAPDRIYVVGGTSAISTTTEAAAGAAANGAELVRLAGPDRSATAVAVARRFVDEFTAALGIDPLVAIGVNLRRADGFTHVLSASSAIGAFSGVFLPIEGEGGTTVPTVVAGVACTIDPLRGVVAGEADLVAEASKQRLNALLEHTAPECRPR